MTRNLKMINKVNLSALKTGSKQINERYPKQKKNHNKKTLKESVKTLTTPQAIT